MLMPTFTMRWILAVFAFLAVLFWVLAAAFRGQLWAIAFSVGMGGMLLMFLIHAILYLAAWWVSLIHSPDPVADRPRSPFAHDVPPPLLLPPEEPR